MAFGLLRRDFPPFTFQCVPQGVPAQASALHPRRKFSDAGEHGELAQTIRRRFIRPLGGQHAMYAFASEVVERISTEPLRVRLNEQLRSMLRQGW